MIWAQFAITTVIMVAAAVKLAEYGDVIAIRTRLGGMFVGTFFLAMATSLPELLTTISAVGQNVSNLAVGNIFGSNMFNIFLLAIVDLFHRQARILRRVALTHALGGSLAILIMAMALFFIVADIDLRIGWLGVDSLLLMVTYFGGLWLLQAQGSGSHEAGPEELESDGPLPSLRRASLGFAAAAAVLVLVTPLMVRSAAGIAEITGVSTGFIGTALVAVITSLPEVVSTFAAARIGAYDLAVGNLFGSNFFNIFALAITDLFYVEGRFLGAVEPAMSLVALLAMILTALALVGNVARLERRLFFIEIDALLIMVIYILGIWFLYLRGVGI